MFFLFFLVNEFRENYGFNKIYEMDICKNSYGILNVYV